ncbi:Hypothetical predicted protein [Octopus vulgaris]|uniref:Uncharacterized protein n=1 Tax=Octopus vulgaris TaxID=6645 RepID=A0AA36F6K0_OCTVU|nr:Hypothetical predicted protein [Octopus vulgaris]
MFLSLVSSVAMDSTKYAKDIQRLCFSYALSVKKILAGRPSSKAETGCSYRCNTTCPLNSHCNMETVVYQVEVTAQGANGQPSVQKYVGSMSDLVRIHFNNHTSLYTISERCNAITAGKYVWALKEGTIEYCIKWVTLERCKLYINSSSKCRLCFFEKRSISKGTQK